MMRNIKYHLALTDNEYSLIINLLKDLRNDLITQGRYTDAVDNVLVKFIGKCFNLPTDTVPESNCCSKLFFRTAHHHRIPASNR